MSTTTTDRTVRSMIRELINASDLTDWREIADAVLAGIDPQDYADALREVLPSYVRLVASRSRQTGSIAGPVQPAPQLQQVSDDGNLPPDAPRKHVSSKIRAINADWRERLREIYPAADGTNKHLGDFTRHDLLAMADRLRRHARHTMARAQGWTELADALSVHQADTVAGLPVSVAERLVKAA
ncbi:hypothetical protein [Kineococcus terrestris]|uniref:hypothetical protein n=1 Tax=Kineococcus terrestris TaxID=2044856 RepID=UPI0034DB6005